MPQCVNEKCACPDCSCGVGCTCGISSDVSCDPCNEFKASKMLQAIPSIKWESHDFGKVMPAFPSSSYEVLDLSKPDALNEFVEHVWTIGKYDEIRSIYQTELFADGRNLHVGLDIGGPIGTPVHAFFDGKVHSVGYNAAEGDYGNVIVIEHVLDGVKLWALYGHLDSYCTKTFKPADVITRGQQVGALGDKHENGGWPPHVHFQLSLAEPATHDMPGAVLQSDRERALRTYPDPQLVTGRFY